MYYSCGNVKVVDGLAGRYREAAAVPLSRFGYRFRIEHIGKPHLVVIRYPDDKRRFIIINDGTSYDLSTGITTGFAQPLSNEMKEIRQVFWPRWNDCTINFMTWGYGEPAAASSIEIFELDELTPLEIRRDTAGGSYRKLGVQYEDPCGIGAAEGAMFFDQWLDRIITHAHHTGQKLLSYPICWYHGPLFPSEREPADCFNIVVAEDRKIYNSWTTQPPDWPAVLLERFDNEGLEFTGALTLLRLGSLMEKMNTDLDTIKAGAETINSMLWNDNVQAGAMDWTKVYNARNYERLVEYSEEGRDQEDNFPWAYGEKSGEPYHPGPIFNPLHPIVQETIVGFISEIGRRYGKYKAFKGISINMWAPTLIWFGSIHSGYDDFAINLFEQETGIDIPVEKTAPDRFSQRYEYLMFKCRPIWISWRCRKIHDLISALRDALVEARSDLKLTLTLWSEPYVPAILGSGGVQHQLYARPSMYELWQEAGLDIRLFGNDSNIEFDLQTEGGQRDRTASLVENAPLEAFCMFRDHDYLDGRSLDAVDSMPNHGVFIFNAWHEAWGNHKWFRTDSDDTLVGKCAYTYGKKAEGIFRMNSEYPADGFWWDSQLRITPAFQPGDHFMEQYAHAVAELDACRITRGGLFLDKAHNEQIRAFALAYCALPAQKFETVSDSTDPVALRTLVYKNKRYFYLQNRDYYPVDVDITFDSSAGQVTDLATGESIKGGDNRRIALQPYQLRSFAMDAGVNIIGFVVWPPVDIATQIMKRAENVLQSLETVSRSGCFISGNDRFADEMREAIKAKRLAWLRRACTSYIARKCDSLADMRGLYD